MKTSEVAPNIYITDTIVHDFLADPTSWIAFYKEFPRKFVGGLHVLTQHDKKEWANKEDCPLRIIEIGTGREEIWFQTVAKGPEYISLDPNGRLTSHLNVGRYRPTLKQETRQSLPGASHHAPYAMSNVELSVWYHDGVIHRNPDRCEGPNKAPAVLSTKMVAPVFDSKVEYIQSIFFTMFQEHWTGGEWDKTCTGNMIINFSNLKLNTPWANKKSLEWLAKHCQGGFFPFSDTLFGDTEEEFLFLTDICSRA
jgi:hypothetical protein